MKVQCHVCAQAAATVLCCAHEAALCAACDLRVHEADKVAETHERLPLTVHCPLSCCDICKENSGLFFCVEDRALLCRDCDVVMHKANKFMEKHSRMLVSGLRVGLEAMLPQSLSSKPSPAASSLDGRKKKTHANDCIRSTTVPHLPSVRTSTGPLFADVAAVEATSHVAPLTGPSQQLMQQILFDPTAISAEAPCSSLSSSSNYPLSWISQFANEPLNSSSSRTTFGKTPSIMGNSSVLLSEQKNVSTDGWSTLSCASPVDMLSLASTNYFFEDSIAEVPSTPISAHHIPCLQDFNHLIQGRQAHEPSRHNSGAATFAFAKHYTSSM